MKRYVAKQLRDSAESHGERDRVYICDIEGCSHAIVMEADDGEADMLGRLVWLDRRGWSTHRDGERHVCPDHTLEDLEYVREGAADELRGIVAAWFDEVDESMVHPEGTPYRGLKQPCVLYVSEKGTDREVYIGGEPGDYKVVLKFDSVTPNMTGDFNRRLINGGETLGKAMKHVVSSGMGKDPESPDPFPVEPLRKILMANGWPAPLREE